MPKNRIEAFSDGVFAIVVTLLVLQLEVPQGAASELPHALLQMWPRFLIYALSFIIVAMFWVGHHVLFHYVTHSDRSMLWLNNLYLLMIGFMPFPTALVAEYPSQQIAVVAYGLNLVMVNIFSTGMWLYATRNRRLVHADLPDSFIRFVRGTLIGPPLIYLLAILLSFFSLIICWVIYIVVPLFYILPNPLIEKQLDHAQQALSPSHAREG